MYIYTPLGRYLYGYVLGFIVPHANIQLEDNKQYISNTPHKSQLFSSFYLSVTYDPKRLICVLNLNYK